MKHLYESLGRTFQEHPQFALAVIFVGLMTLAGVAGMICATVVDVVEVSSQC